MASTFDDLYKYYRILNPNVDYQTGIRTVFVPNVQGPANENVIVDLIYESYINKTTSGEDLVKKEELKEASSEGLFFNTVYQSVNDSSSKFLSRGGYWSVPDPAAKKDDGSVVTVNNYWREVVAASGKQPIDFTVNILRSPYLTNARRNVDEITTFLNYMPSIFASKMVPYFDVEMQLPNDEYKSKENFYLNKPSLLRFFLGSVNVKDMPLTDAAKSLILTQKTPTLKTLRTEPKSDYSHFLGMEYFTTPQTLVNMEGLRASDGVRLNDVKPFLPPATIVSADLQAANAGAGVFVHTTGRLVMKIHDKARLVEFAEFLRGGPGYQNATIWLTYGWLAPRSNTDEDIYAKFINSTMLVRQAYSVKNASYSFGPTGEVTVNIELVSKAILGIQTNSLNDVEGGDNLTGKAIIDSIKTVEDLLNKVRNARPLFGDPPEGMQEVRFFQIIDAAMGGQFNIDIEPDQVKKIIQEAINALKDPTRSRLKPPDNQTAINALQAIIDIYADREVISNIKKSVYDYTAGRIRACYDGASFDPFLAASYKSDYFGSELIGVVNKNSQYTQQQLTKIDESAKPKDKTYETIDASGKKVQKKFPERKHPSLPDSKELKKNMVSFGKLFSVFCLPPLLKSCSEEGVNEVQINFYQFNGSCGPMSYHNIAEFPIDVRLFMIQFQHFIESRGGETMTIQQFLEFVMSTQIADMRSPGYDMADMYEPYSADKLEETKNKEFDTKIAQWLFKYGEFVKPALVVYAHTEKARPADSASSNVDLLYEIGSKVGGEQASKINDRNDGTKIIKKIHIYDKTASVHGMNSMRRVKTEENGQKGFRIVKNENLPAFARMSQLVTQFDVAAAGPAAKARVDAATNFGTRFIPSDKNVVREFMSNTVPTIEVGTNSSLVSNISLASKVDGYIGVMNLQGGSGRASSKLDDNALKSEVHGLPMRMTPAELTMTTLGCPLANLYQQFYVDLGTGTTLDNIYTATTIQHSFAPGKFDTAWTFGYADGYGKFYGAAQIQDVINELQQPPPDPA